MEDMCLRFCHISRAIFEKVDNESLNESRKISRSVCKSIDSQRSKWKRIILKCIGTNISESWKIVLFKAPTKIVHELAKVVQKFYKGREISKAILHLKIILSLIKDFCRAPFGGEF